MVWIIEEFQKKLLWIQARLQQESWIIWQISFYVSCPGIVAIFIKWSSIKISKSMRCSLKQKKQSIESGEYSNCSSILQLGNSIWMGLHFLIGSISTSIGIYLTPKDLVITDSIQMWKQINQILDYIMQ